ncbi:hypothetical protein [Rhodococcus tukisamuensis]|uniref:Uncharacterized protein n=1 Tax=Rhodococcus tukisamuensis TaxID=168276 RepID=A0A1G6QMN0_9NOCA|nr:hypothetical protein [Rhodococcus tukisamuensis]SDC93578.1 hypothetical protein SAMN05444580_102131 [Rhodococcus tukisamuensis]
MTAVRSRRPFRGVALAVDPRKVVRQKLMQMAVLEKIDGEHLPINTDQVHGSLLTIREHVQGKTMTDCLDRWDQLIRDNDLDSIRRIVTADGETSDEMRNLSPLTVLLSERERRQVLSAVRRHFTEHPEAR